MTRRKLFHFTCEDAAPLILDCGMLVPGPLWGMVWLTDVPHPERLALGLTSHSLTCDRMAWRFTVKAPAIPWSVIRAAVPDNPLFDEIESTPGADPSRWYVSLDPVRVRKSCRYIRPVSLTVSLPEGAR